MTIKYPFYPHCIFQFKYVHLHYQYIDLASNCPLAFQCIINVKVDKNTMSHSMNPWPIIIFIHVQYHCNITVNSSLRISLQHLFTLFPSYLWCHFLFSAFWLLLGLFDLRFLDTGLCGLDLDHVLDLWWQCLFWVPWLDSSSMDCWSWRSWSSGDFGNG